MSTSTFVEDGGGGAAPLVVDAVVAVEEPVAVAVDDDGAACSLGLQAITARTIDRTIAQRLFLISNLSLLPVLMR
jgi:hypothetical protein